MAEAKAHIVRIKGKQKDPDGGEPTTLDDVYADLRCWDENDVLDRGTARCHVVGAPGRMIEIRTETERR